MQPENQPPNNQLGQSPPLNNGQGFLSVAHNQPTPRTDVAASAAMYYAPLPTAAAYVPAPRLPQVSSLPQLQPQPLTPLQPPQWSQQPPPQSLPPRQYQQQYEQYQYDTSPPVSAPPQAYAVPSLGLAPLAAPIEYAGPSRQSWTLRRKLIVVAGFVLFFAAGVAVGLFVPLPGVRPGAGTQIIGGNRASSLLAPINFQYSIVDTTSVSFSWSAVKDASSYTLSYATDEAFTKDVQTKADIKDVSITLHEFKEGKIYYLRVIAHKGNESSGPSGVLVVDLTD